ncbi:MAG: hydroxylamine reductase [Anaerovoracaceae bacterium]|jgi:hydroxylamine reductase
MDERMFCFQCEQTAGCTGCTGAAGVCGKKAGTAGLQDELTGALITLARLEEKSGAADKDTYKTVAEGLFTTVTNVNFADETIREQIEKVKAESARLAGAASSDSGVCAPFDMKKVWHHPDENIRSLKSLILFGLRGTAAYAYHALHLGYTDTEVDRAFCEGLRKVGFCENKDELLNAAMEAGKANVSCMALLDKANTETYGTPLPAEVTMKVEKGPFIVVTGHDLKDLKMLLEQTAGTGVNVYTHGEMLPAHGYPELRKYDNLKGNFGTAWQNQKKEFDGVPAAFLFTTNCLMPPLKSYSDRVFTTGPVSFPGIAHIGEDKDFTPVIEQAKALGGYSEDKQFTGINGGKAVITGFGRGAVLSVADKVIESIKAGHIRHIFLVAGCDGAKPGRNYYTEFVKKTPADTLVLTLACGKYRFNDLNLGSIDGIPRLLDMGQCNDAYGAVQVALALADAFGCGINDLPLSFVLSWYEQKAVSILLSLLALGVKNIKLGPTLPAFISPDILNYLVENYNIAPVTTPEADMKELLGE